MSCSRSASVPPLSASEKWENIIRHSSGPATRRRGGAVGMSSFLARNCLGEKVENRLLRLVCAECTRLTGPILCRRRGATALGGRITDMHVCCIMDALGRAGGGQDGGGSRGDGGSRRKGKRDVSCMCFFTGTCLLGCRLLSHRDGVFSSSP
jgi:hypothetical protein